MGVSCYFDIFSPINGSNDYSINCINRQKIHKDKKKDRKKKEPLLSARLTNIVNGIQADQTYAKDLLEEYIAANKGFQEIHVMFDFS